MTDIEFAHIHFLWLLLVIPLLIGWYIWKHNRSHAKVRLSTLDSFAMPQTTAKVWMRHLPFALRMMAIGVMVVAMGRPQSSASWQEVTTEGIDIVIALDISSSMLAEDFKPNRLEASKAVAIDFIDDRPNDRIGLVVYSAKSFTQCPLTTDHAKVKNLFEGIKHGIIQDGTAIGMGLANAVNRLKESNAKSKVVILLTDGFNTAGSIPPLTAAEIAKAFDVRVYTIGVGKNGMAPMPVKTFTGRTVRQNMEVKIDEKSLKEIAKMTGGKYFRATDNGKLKEIYESIDQLEKTIIEEIQYEKKSEWFWPWVLAASVLLAIEFILRNTVFRSLT